MRRGFFNHFDVESDGKINNNPGTFCIPLRLFWIHANILRGVYNNDAEDDAGIITIFLEGCSGI